MKTKDSQKSNFVALAKAIVLILAVLVLGTQAADASYMKNVPQTLTQPDGTTLKCFATGDEFYHWLHDANNFTIIQDTVTGFFVYATKSEGKLAPTTLIAGKSNPAKAKLMAGINIEPEQVIGLTKTMFSVPSFKGSSSVNTIGTINNIVIFVRFNDQAEYTDQLSKYDQAFNSTSTPSMLQFFEEVSGSQVTINSTLYPKTAGKTVVSYQDSKTRNYYCRYNATTNPIGFQTDADRATREMSLLKSAVESVKSQLEATGLNFDTDNNGQVDNVCFVIQGATDGWADLLWPHQWALYAYNVKIGQARVWNYNLQIAGVFGLNVLCHEMSHSLGFPDLYRYTNNTINPVGPWDAMSSTTNPPQHQCVYTKEKYGHWTNAIPEITAAGTYSLKPLANDPFAAFKIASPNSTSEYFVVEYRRATGVYESQLLGSGLVIYRVNPSINGNSFGPNDEVYVFRPNGTNSVDGDLAKAFFSADANRTTFGANSTTTCFLSDGSKGGVQINNIGTAGETISFSVTFGNNPLPVMAIAPATRTISAEAASTTFNVSNVGGGNLDWTAEVTGGSNWAHITGGVNGNNDGNITVEVDANNGETRTATIRVISAGADTKTISLTQDITNGISTVSTASNLNVYPNPSVRNFNVQLGNFNGLDKKLEVINMMGQVQSTQTLSQENTTIDCSDLPKGIYVFRVTAENNSVSFNRVVKN